MLSSVYAVFYSDLLAFIPDSRIYTDPLRTLAYGTDASFYRLTPAIVVDALSEGEIIEILRLARRHKVSVTFRAAGTSLSGQGVTDSVLVRLGYGWRGYRISEDGGSISLQPGVIGAHANRLLAPLGRKIGPDPASIDSCMVGGIAANNASGMCCGVADNSYKTLLSARIILADGTLLDTANAADKQSFAVSHKPILDGLVALRQKVLADKDLAERIRRKYRIKNTTGYSLNALVDFEDPYEILEHLLIGSEGTLGFFAEVTYKTVQDHPFKASSLMLFSSVSEACRAAIILKTAPISSSELMDRASLRSVEALPGIPAHIAGLGDNVCSLLVETRAASEKDLETQIKTVTKAVQGLDLVQPVTFVDVEKEYAALWNIRKGILPSVSAVRVPGETSLIEDVAVPIESLAAAAQDIQNLFSKYGYSEGVLFGHARDGNLHFCFNQNFEDEKEIARYAAFMDDICDCIAVKYEGSLKAEHGTGRNMAPYVELEWGKAAYALMGEIKTLLDPEGLLNPGVILNNDPKSHITALKPLTPAHALIDACSECGFCESTCPSRRLSLTPRQRISSWRAITRLSDPTKKAELLEAMRQSYTYQGRDTCAADGLCALRCPAQINTGAFIKYLRTKERGSVAKGTAAFIGKHFRGVTLGTSVLLASANLVHQKLGASAMQKGAAALRIVSRRATPVWNKAMPTGVLSLPAVQKRHFSPQKPVVYFPSCISRSMGPSLDSPDRRDEMQIAVDLLVRAGFSVIYPKGVERLCCGMSFASKGFPEEATAREKELNAALLAATDNGRIPVLSETSPCLAHMRETLDPCLKLYEPIQFALEYIVPALNIRKLPKSVAIHATCSTRKMGLAEQLAALAALCAEKVVIPTGVECCGWAGDKGFSHPELNQAALHDLRLQVSGCDAGYSTSRTCQIGLTLHGGIPYMSILALLDEASS